jgi:hypothetical protein
VEDTVHRLEPRMFRRPSARNSRVTADSFVRLQVPTGTLAGVAVSRCEENRALLIDESVLGRNDPAVFSRDDGVGLLPIGENCLV